jgi:metal-sulfur cluster biosynthetic enzyme
MAGRELGAMTVTPEQVWTALGSVCDPELGMSIVDLGLVYRMEIHDDAVRITMTLSTTGCPLHESITDWVHEAIRRVPGVSGVDVQVTFDPPWSPKRIQPGSHRAPFPR